jgi:hypothetical protein
MAFCHIIVMDHVHPYITSSQLRQSASAAHTYKTKNTEPHLHVQALDYNWYICSV